MVWSGGNYTKGNNATGGWTGDASLGIGIEAGRHDTQDNDFATGIDQCLNKDGSNAATGNLNLGGFIPTNIGAGTAAAPAVCVGGDTNTGVFGPTADTWAVATNGTERLRVDSTGKVGIGTTVPANGFNVVQYDSFSGDLISGLFQASKATTSDAGVALGSTNGNTPFIAATRLNNGTGTATPLVFKTDGIERLRLDTGNNMSGGAGNSSWRIRAAYNPSGNFDTYTTFSQNWNYNTNTADSTANGTAAISIAGGASNYSAIVFYTNINNTAPAERMRITSAGSVGIGGTPVGKFHTFSGLDDDTIYVETSNNRPTVRYLRSGTSYATTFVDGNGFTTGSNNSYACRAGASGGVYLAATATAWSAISDERFKKNIKPLGYGLNEVMQLNPVRFDYIDDSSEESARIGFIAQQVKPIIPEAIQGSEEIRLGLSITELIPALVKAIQELNAKVEALEAQLAATEVV